MTNIKTIIHTYCFDTSDPDKAAEYKELRKKLKPDHPNWMHCNANPLLGKKRIEWKDGQEVELETECIFSNQWNTVCGKRVFDWYEGIYYNHQGNPNNFREGHWLEITPEMVQVRENTFHCGYCGAHYQAQQGYIFCDRCLDSEYLEEDKLYMLRLTPFSVHFPKSKPLTKAEKDHLLPQYIKRQTEGDDSRAVKKRNRQRRDIEEKYQKNKERNETEHDGMMWLWNNNVSLDNVIYYSHTNKFCFGWRSPVSRSVKSKLLEMLCEFMFDYEIKEEGQ